MNTIIKTLEVSNAQLNVIAAGRRMRLADFNGKVEITEVQSIVPVLGRKCRGEKKIYASFIMCEDTDYKTDSEIHSGKVYEAIGDVQGESHCERLLFSGLRYENMNPLEGSVTFEVNDLELIKKMLDM